MDDAVEQIKERTELSRIVGNYVQLKKSGINMSGRCPFHREKTPSFYVSDERGTYKCFGCGEGGDVFTFLEHMEGLSFKEALAKLAVETGVSLNNSSGRKQTHGVDSKDRLRQCMKLAVTFWQRSLAGSPEAIEYLKKRGFTKQQVIDYQIGYAPDEWSSLKGSLLEKGVSEKDLIDAGLVKYNDERKSSYDRFRKRIMFPLRSVTGEVIAASGRYLGNDKEDKTAKYLNSPETALFSKSKELYGFDTAKEAIRKNAFVIVVEGQVDMVMSQSVFANTVATSGTALTEQHMKSLKRFCSRVLFMFDSDDAGINASHKASLIAFAYGFEVRIATLPKGKDPADIVAESIEEYRAHVRNAQDIFDFWIGQVNQSDMKGADRSILIEQRILPLIKSLESALEQDRYIAHVAEHTLYSKEALLRQLDKTSGSESPIGEYEQKEPIPSVLGSAERRLLGIYHYAQVKNKSSVLNLFNTRLQDTLKLKQESLGKEEQEQILFEIEKDFQNDIMIENDLKELLVIVQNAQKIEKKKQLLERYKQLIREHKTDEASIVLQEINSLKNNNNG